MSGEVEMKEKAEIRTSAVEIFEDGTRCYILWFRFGNRPPLSKVFLLEGDLPKAIDRARVHCERMNYRFCGCYPFIVDLDVQEDRHKKAMTNADELGIDVY